MSSVVGAFAYILLVDGGNMSINLFEHRYAEGLKDVAEIIKVEIRSLANGRNYAINLEKSDATPDEIRSLCLGERETDELRTFTRVVGYYSNTGNWNKSKLGELKDRRKGNYDIL